MTDEARKRRGRSARRKGGLFELEVVKNHTEVIQVPAEKVPLSGALPGHKGDVKVDVLGGLRGECKARKSGDGFRTLESWMEGNDLLFLKRNGKAPMVCLTWSVYANLIAAAHEESAISELRIDFPRDKSGYTYLTYAAIQASARATGSESESEDE